MSLYELVSLKQLLIKSIEPQPAIDQLLILRDNIHNIKNLVSVSLDNEIFIDTTVDYYNNLINLAQQPLAELTKKIDAINTQINEITHRLFYNNYELEELYSSVENDRIARKIHIGKEVEDIIRQRIWINTNWKYPALEIGCRDGEWTREMVAADPLYVVDHHHEFLNAAVKQFTPEYQRRIRPYHLNNHDLSILPQDQFGFIFSWGYFNYVSIDTIKKYLQQIMKLLRPGGLFLFSYNDGDTPTGAAMAESFSQTYLPKSALILLCQSMGFEIENVIDPANGISLLEIKRPGTLHTIKAHQVLGEMKRREI
jgi:SAM-dependent methyltransferase